MWSPARPRPDTGEVFFDGQYDLSRLDETEIALLGIGRKFQKPTVFEMHTVEDNIGLALKGDRASARRCSGTKRPRAAGRVRPHSRYHPAVVAARAGRRLAVARQKQWLEIGMLLAQEPKLMLVDEPVAGMTDNETRQTAELLKEINRDRTVVVVEHDMTFVRELGVKVTVPARRFGAGGRNDRPGFRERARVEVYLGR